MLFQFTCCVSAFLYAESAAEFQAGLFQDRFTLFEKKTPGVSLIRHPVRKHLSVETIPAD